MKKEFSDRKHVKTELGCCVFEINKVPNLGTAIVYYKHAGHCEIAPSSLLEPTSLQGGRTAIAGLVRRNQERIMEKL